MTYSRQGIQTVEPGPGQESVWDFPRPPRVESEARPVKIVFAGQTIVETDGALRVLETSHPPNIYVPFEDVSREVLRANDRRTICEWKGAADYWDVVVGSRSAESGAWTYAKPRPDYHEISGYVSFYPALMDGCYLGDEQVTPQPGGFYGGWITPDVVGPFKGAEGTWGW
ncbi:MAG: DUF427 domain-containing protein [Acidimicrobiia bacterium]